MIKKIVIIVAVAVLFIVPAVSANDGWYINGDKEIGIKIIPSSYHASIGEEYKFIIEITNYTDETFDYMFMDNAFTANIWTEHDFEMELLPYRTVQIDAELIIDERLDWYKDGSKFYTTLNPHFMLSIKGSGGTYTVYPRKEIKIELDNLGDGSKYMSADIIDNSKYLIYQARETDFYSNDYSAVGGKYNEVLLKNIGSKQIDEISYPDEYHIYKDLSLQLGESISKRMYFYDEEPLYTVSERQKVSHPILFKIEGQYYGVFAEKYYDTKMFYHPQIKLEVGGEKDEQGNITKHYFEVTNYSSDYIRNFYVNFESGYQSLPDYIFDVISPNETKRIEMPLEQEGHIWKFCSYGYFVPEDSFIIGWEDYYLEQGVETIETDKYEKWIDYLGNNLTTYAEDLEYIFAEIDMDNQHSEYETSHYINSIAEELNPTPTVCIETASPESKVTNTPALTAASAIAATPETTETAYMKIEAKKMPYIPTWAWIAVLAAAVVSGALIYYIKKSKKDELND